MQGLDVRVPNLLGIVLLFLVPFSASGAMISSSTNLVCTQSNLYENMIVLMTEY